MKTLPLRLAISILAAVAVAPAFAVTNTLWQPGTFSDGEYKPTCTDCYIQQVEILVPATGVVVKTANPQCGEQDTVDFFNLAQAAVTAYIDPSASGNLTEIAKRFAHQSLRDRVGGMFQDLLDANGPRTDYGDCAPLAASIPRDAVVEAIHLGDWDNNVGAGACGAQLEECANSWARFLITPEAVKPATGAQTVSTLFINWSHDRDRVARMFVSYHMPSGKTPVKYD
jgi:hypothetical protein